MLGLMLTKQIKFAGALGEILNGLIEPIGNLVNSVISSNIHTPE